MPLPEQGELFFGLQLTEEQKEYADSVFDNQLTIVNAKAGTGKTTIAVGCAKLLNDIEDRDLLYTFAPVEERTLGFTTGDPEEKESKYLTPLIDALTEIGERPDLALHREKNPDQINDVTWVQAKSHAYMRGSNIDGKVLIIDEAQNMTRGDLKKVLTRVKDSTKVIMIGHEGQCDLPKSSVSGFAPYLEWFKDEPYAKVIELTHNFRGPLAQKADELNW